MQPTFHNLKTCVFFAKRISERIGCKKPYYRSNRCRTGIVWTQRLGLSVGSVTAVVFTSFERVNNSGWISSLYREKRITETTKCSERDIMQMYIFMEVHCGRWHIRDIFSARRATVEQRSFNNVPSPYVPLLYTASPTCGRVLGRACRKTISTLAGGSGFI